MPRNKPTTTFTPRVKPTTQYEKPRDREESPVSFDSVEITFDSTQYTWDMIFEDLWPITSIFSTPRKDKFVEDTTGQNVLDLLWEQVLWISGNLVNKIDTIWQ